MLTGTWSLRTCSLLIVLRCLLAASFFLTTQQLGTLLSSCARLLDVAAVAVAKWLPSVQQCRKS